MDFKLNDDLMLYFSYAEGFKSGGFDMRGNQLPIRTRATATTPRPRTTSKSA